MSGTEEFFCFPCAHWWRDTYSLWRAYLSNCPRCGSSRQAYRDTDVFADRREMESLPRYDTLYDAPAFDQFEKTEEGLEDERDQIHDEIAEALGAVESDVSGADQESDSDQDGDGDKG